MLTLGVVGSRDFDDQVLLDFVMAEYMIEYDGNLTIVSGGARGADREAKIWAQVQEPRLPITEYYAEWDKHGKAAGYIRNAEIVKASDEILAFWDGKSKGTQHTINLAKKANKTVTIIEYEKFRMGKDRQL